MLIEFSVLTDGTSDRALIPLIRWALCRSDPDAIAANGRIADLRHLSQRPRTMTQRIQSTADLYPAQLYFVHRDAEDRSHAHRLQEIEDGAAGAGVSAIPVVPVRMTEAWLLFDEDAIRRAAGNPNGTMPLDLPQILRLEDVVDPKARLFETLKRASGLSGRRLKSFRPHAARSLVADLIGDFSALQALPAFSDLLARVDASLAAL